MSAISNQTISHPITLSSSLNNNISNTSTDHSKNCEIDVDNYVACLSQNLIYTDEPVHLNYYLRAQLAMVLGKYEEAVTLLLTALDYIETHHINMKNTEIGPKDRFPTAQTMKNSHNSQESTKIKVSKSESSSSMRLTPSNAIIPKSSNSAESKPSNASTIGHSPQVSTSVKSYSANPFHDSDTDRIGPEEANDIPPCHLHATILGLLASSYDYLGKYDLAEEYFDKANRLDPIGSHIGEYAIFFHRRLKQHDKAAR